MDQIYLEINYIAVVILAIIPMIVGGLWYSPGLFGNEWMKLIGRKENDIQKPSRKEMLIAYGGTFLSCLVMSYVLAAVVKVSGANSLLTGAMVGLVVFLGFFAAGQLAAYIFEGRPFKLFLINIGSHLISLVLMSSLFAIL